jgi:amino acid transporter
MSGGCLSIPTLSIRPGRKRRMRKILEFAEYISIGTGMALACSCFMVLGGVLKSVSGLWFVTAIVAGGLLTLPIALSIAEWASLLPGGAGISAYLKSAFGEKVSLFFMALYLSLVGCLAGVESFVFTQLLEQLFPGQFPAIPSALVILMTILVLNLAGFEFSRGFQLFTTTSLTLGILFLAGTALLQAFTTPSPFVPTSQPLTTEMVFRLGSAIGTSLFLFVGFEWVAPMGRSQKAYGKLIPASMVASVLVLMLLYGTFSLALVAGPGSDLARGSAVPQFVLSEWVLGPYARVVAAGLSLLAMVTSFNAGMLGAGRMVYALARQNYLPKRFAQVTEKRGQPIYAIALAGLLSCISAALIIAFNVPMVASAVAACIICWVYAALMYGLIRHRKILKINRGGFHSPIPMAFQWVLAVLLPILGLSALFVDRLSALSACALLFVLSMVAWVFAHQSKQGEIPKTNGLPAFSNPTTQVVSTRSKGVLS